VSKLTTLIFIFVSPTLAGLFVIGVLAADMALSNAMPIIIAAALGVVAAIPASYFIARAIQETERRRAQPDTSNG
jgi:membrane protein DedA with SNARE-associated domain